jgi:hypothetical protein
VDKTIEELSEIGLPKHLEHELLTMNRSGPKLPQVTQGDELSARMKNMRTAWEQKLSEIFGKEEVI